jgi:TetR/AcrR family transcriptional repressor of nem operon
MSRGRPKSFDENQALEQAMHLFWKKGYDATSLDELVVAMAIPRQSLYRTFGDKRTLFIRALGLYANHINQAITHTLLADGLAIDNINQVFQRWSERLTSTERQGCMMQNTLSQSILVDEAVTTLIATHQQRITLALTTALERGQQQGNIKPSIVPEAMARTILSSINGMLALSRTSLSKDFSADVIQTLKSCILK